MKMITEDMNIIDILDQSPEMEKVFLRHGLNCAGCPGSHMESLREAAEGHGIDVKALVADLNGK